MLCWKFKGKVYMELGAPFGLACIVRVFTVFDRGLEWVVIRDLPPELPAKDLVRQQSLLYIDDITLGAKTEASCRIFLDHYQSTCKKLGLEINCAKTQQPTQRPVVLGFQYDLREQSITIPEEKRRKLRNLLERVSTF